MVNPFNVPREEQTFLGMMDRIFDGLGKAVKEEKEKIEKEEEAYAEVSKQEKNKEIHIHVHTEGQKKKDPNAKVRNRSNPIFPSTSKFVNDEKDHFPIPDIKHGRNALSRVAQYDKIPPWFNGTLKELQAKVRSAVKKAFPDIDVTMDSKSQELYPDPDIREELLKFDTQSVQAVIFDVNYFDISRAGKWLRLHGFLDNEMKEQDDGTIYFRQRKESDFDGTLNSMKLADGITVLMGNRRGRE